MHGLPYPADHFTCDISCIIVDILENHCGTFSVLFVIEPMYSTSINEQHSLKE